MKTEIIYYLPLYLFVLVSIGFLIRSFIQMFRQPKKGININSFAGAEEENKKLYSLFNN